MTEPIEMKALSVLVVDDSPIMRKMVIHSLKMSGIPLGAVAQAADGAEALELVSASAPDVVLCDVHMPQMDGLEFVRRLRGDGRITSVPVVMISSERNAAQQSALQELGARGYLHKPFYPETLGELLRRIFSPGEAP